MKNRHFCALVILTGVILTTLISCQKNQSFSTPLRNESTYNGTKTIIISPDSLAKITNLKWGKIGPRTNWVESSNLGCCDLKYNGYTKNQNGTGFIYWLFRGYQSPGYGSDYVYLNLKKNGVTHFDGFVVDPINNYVQFNCDEANFGFYHELGQSSGTISYTIIRLASAVEGGEFSCVESSGSFSYQ
jgi:hypothetical protein